MIPDIYVLQMLQSDVEEVSKWIITEMKKKTILKIKAESEHFVVVFLFHE